MPDFPFTPGSARQVDPAKEAERLAEERKTAGMVVVPRRDLAVLVALARGGVRSPAALPDGMTIGEAVKVLERYAAC